MSAINIARKDMQILAKDRSAVIELFVLPLVFILLFGGIWSAAANAAQEEATRKVPLPVVNMDTGGAASEVFINNLNSVGGVEVVEYNESEAQAAFSDEEIVRIMTLPAGFSEDLSTGREVQIHVISEGTNAEEDRSILLAVEGVARSMSLERQILASLQQIGEMQAEMPEEEQIFTAERSIQQAKSQFEESKTRPLVSIEEIYPESIGQQTLEQLNPVQIAVPGMTVLFVFLTAQATAKSIFEEKKIGSFRRLLAAPMSKASLLGGKMLPSFFTVIVQVIVIFGVAMVVFPLLGMGSLSLGSDLFALILLVLVMALCSTAFGVLITAIAKTEAQIGGISQAALWIMGFVGGAVVPLFLLSDAMAAIGKVTPHYWAVTGFYDLLVRGGDLAMVQDSLLALLGFSVVFFAIGLWRFDFD